MSTPSPTRWGLADAAGGLILAAALLLAVGFASAHFWITDSHVLLLLSYLAVWVPLLGAVLVACFVPGSGSVGGSGWFSGGGGSLVGDLGLRFRPIDVLWGLFVGLLARVVASLIEIAEYGHIGTSSVTFGDTVYDGWWLFGALLAPGLIAPLIEELFFRGLVLRALVARPVIAVILSGALFALLHVLQADSMTVFAVVGLSTLVFGLAAATLAATTGRLGGAIIAHVTFNALVLVPGLF